MNEFRLDRGYITVIVGQATASARGDGKFVRLDVQQEALDSETVVELTPEEALWIASALIQRAVLAKDDAAQWKALRQTKDMLCDTGAGVAA